MVAAHSWWAPHAWAAVGSCRVFNIGQCNKGDECEYHHACYVCNSPYHGVLTKTARTGSFQCRVHDAVDVALKHLFERSAVKQWAHLRGIVESAIAMLQPASPVRPLLTSRLSTGCVASKMLRSQRCSFCSLLKKMFGTTTTTRGTVTTQ